MIQLTKENFEQEVMQSASPVLIDFYADWCGPCKMMSPVLEEFANEHPEIKVCKLNTDEQIELSLQYKVASIPMFVAVKNGETVGKTIGVSPKEELLALFEA
jgi:thioredoxin 1